MKIRFAPMLIFLLIIVSDAFASTKGDVKKGNLLYNKKQYAEAAKLYEEALAKNPSAAIASFNAGLAKYRQAAYSGAIEKFNKTIAASRMPGMISASDYNIGNAYYRIGNASEAQDIKKAKESYETALKFYKRSMDLNPDDKDAKFNYEFVRKKIDALSEKFQMKKDEKKDQKKQDQNKENKDKNDQNKDQQKDQDKDQQQQNQQQQDKGQDKQDQGKGGEEKSEGQKQQEEKSKEDQQKEGQEKGDKGKEEGKPQGAGEEEKKPRGGGEENDKEDQPQGGEEGKEEKEQPQGAGQEEKSEDQPTGGAGEEEKPAGSAEEKEEQPAGGAEEKEEQAGLQAYQAPQAEGQGVEMSAQEAKMLLEGYKGEEATGAVVRMRKKRIDLPEPAKDW